MSSEFDVTWAVETLAKTGTPSDTVKQQVRQLVLAAGGALASADARELVRQVRDLPNAERVFVVDEQGEPLGVFSMPDIGDEGSRLAFAMAETCHDETAMFRAQRECLERVGSATYGYVAAYALGILAGTILAGAFAVAKSATGIDLQADLSAIARGDDPNGGRRA